MRNLGTSTGLGVAPATHAQLVPAAGNPSPSGTRQTLRGQFLQHPRGFPLACRPLSRWRRLLLSSARRHDFGLRFHAPRAIPIGTALELAIPLRHGQQHFVGPVVFIRELADGFEIGVEVALADAERAAIVARICELEARLQLDDGNAAHRRAREWAALRPRLERIPSLKNLLFAASRAGLPQRG